MRNLRCAIVASTAGSVMNVALGNDFFRGIIDSVVCDRDGGAAVKAQAHGLPVRLFRQPDPEVFGRSLLAWLEERRIDYVFSFYTQLYSDVVRAAYSDRLINLHPSLLPAFKGMDGFGDGWRSGARFLGSTVEFIDQVMDEGKIILQTAFPVDPQMPMELTRHRLFVQQCKSLVQVARWLAEDRIVVRERRVTVREACFGDPEFAPALDFAEAAGLHVPPLVLLRQPG